MKLNLHSLFPYFALTFLFLSGCDLTPTPTSNSLIVNLVSPRTSTVVWPQSPYVLAAQAYTQDAVNQPVHITFYANDQMIGDVDSSTGSQAVLKWTPPAVGAYNIQAKAQANSESASSKTIQMCILNIDTSQGFRLWGYGYNGPCVLPPASPSKAAVKLTPTAKPASLSYSYNCPSSVGPTIINFQIKVNDPGNRVAFVDVKYMGQNYALKSPLVIDGTSQNDVYDSVILNETSVASDGTKIYTGSTEDLGPISSTSLSGATAAIQWSARAMQSTGVSRDQLLVEDGPYLIPIGPCTPPAETPVQ
jgi:hypothetical protein